MKKLSSVTSTLFVALLLVPQIVAACSVCFGAPADHPITHSLDLAIVTLIGITGTVLGGIATFFVFLLRRGKRINEIMDISDSPNGNGSAH